MYYIQFIYINITMNYDFIAINLLTLLTVTCIVNRYLLDAICMV